MISLQHSSNHFVFTFVSYVIFKKAISDRPFVLKLRLQIFYFFYMKWCPSVTEHSEGPMDTVSSRADPLYSVIIIGAKMDTKCIYLTCFI